MKYLITKSSAINALLKTAEMTNAFVLLWRKKHTAKEAKERR